jgi:serine/threonine protein kinase
MASELIPVPRDLEFDVTIRGLNATQQVFERYNLQRVLGRGGMGIVWLAQDERLEREVALKFLPDDVFFDPVALDELKRETRRCLDLTHPGIIRIYDFIKDDRAAAISMEYIDGKTLAEVRIEKPQRMFEVDELRGWIGNICQALHYAHGEAGVVHRDLKPANLMLTSRGQVKIADFGISQSMSDSMSRRTIRRGTSSGTLAYMSPQQLNGEVARPTDDIYALGATIYELLTGKPPFHSGDVPFQIRLGVPKSVAERRAEFELAGDPIPPEWEAAIEACLSKVPAERPATMGELAERLGLAGGAPRPAAASPEIERPRPKPAATSIPPARVPRNRTLQRSPAVLAGAAAAVIVALGLPAYLIFKLSERDKSAVAAAPANLPSAPERLVVPSADPAPVVDAAPVVPDTSGTLVINSIPAGASVRVAGQPERQTPATYAHLAPGSYAVTISEPGYEVEQSTVTVTSNTKTDTGALQLRRATGDLNLVSVPPQAHYELSGQDQTAGVQRSGTTPDLVSGLPAGSYQITFTSPGVPAAVSSVDVAAHQKSSLRTDLVDRAVTHDATAAATSVFHGSAAVSSLDEAGRGDLARLSTQAFQLYLAAGLLDEASGQLDMLRSLGQDTTALQAQLVSKSSAVEQAFESEVQALVAGGKLATAQERLQQLRATLDPGAVSRIEGPYRNQLDAYQAQIDAVVQASQAQAPETADDPLRLLAKQYPDDLHLLLARAQVVTRMPPSADSLATQIKAFQKFVAQNKTFATDSVLGAMQQVFAGEQQQLIAVAQDLKAAKKGPATLRADIDELEERKGIYHRRHVGAPKGNPFSSTINFFGKAVTGHTVVDNAAYFSSSEAKRDAIAELQARIDQDKASLAQPPASLQDAQNRYDQFIARVPWSNPAAPTATAAVSPSVPAPL